MEILRFTLSGKQAFFKKPDVNTYYYFTFGHIHKVALLGMFGAILGYGGYNSKSLQNGNIQNKSKEESKKDGSTLPEFYEKLKDIKVAVMPFGEKGCFQKKIVSFNNSVGYASKETGGNLIIKEQWLEQPKWNVYVLLDNGEASKIADSMIKRRCVYVPYLGKNDHAADISEVEMISGILEEHVTKIDSFFVKGNLTIDIAGGDDEEEKPFKYEESLPVSLNRMGMYEYKKFVYSNLPVQETNCNVYKIYDNEKHEKESELKKQTYNIVFY